MEPLEALDSLELPSGYRLRVSLEPTRISWQSFFEVRIEKSGQVSSVPAASGVYSRGHHTFRAPGWMDLNYRSKHQVGDTTIDLSSSRTDEAIFASLGSVIPAGGSMMVAYRMFVGEEQIHRDTREALDVGVPPVLTPIGFLMFKADCGWSFKDWYFAEGGREGPEKLQGFKPATESARSQAANRLSRNVNDFLQASENVEHLHVLAARKKAKLVLQALNGG